MQCTSFYRDPYEQAAWHLYLHESTIRTAHSELIFLQACGGARPEDLERLRNVVVNPSRDVVVKIEDEDARPPAPIAKVSLKSVLAPISTPRNINQLCRRAKPLLQKHCVPTFVKHNATYVFESDAQRIRDLVTGK
jgi:hypothetical protein